MKFLLILKDNSDDIHDCIKSPILASPNQTTLEAEEILAAFLNPQNRAMAILVLLGRRALGKLRIASYVWLNAGKKKVCWR